MAQNITLTIRGRKLKDSMAYATLSDIDKRIKFHEQELAKLKRAKIAETEKLVGKLHTKQWNYSVYFNSDNSVAFDVTYYKTNPATKEVYIYGEVKYTDYERRFASDREPKILYFDLSPSKSWRKSYFLSMLEYHRNMIGSYKTVTEGLDGLLGKRIYIDERYILRE